MIHNHKSVNEISKDEKISESSMLELIQKKVTAPTEKRGLFFGRTPAWLQIQTLETILRNNGMRFDLVLHLKAD